MKLVENYINRLGKFSQEPKDIGDKGYDSFKLIYGG